MEQQAISCLEDSWQAVGTAHGLCPWSCCLFWLLETHAWQATILWASLRLDSPLHLQHKDIASDVLEPHHLQGYTSGSTGIHCAGD